MIKLSKHFMKNWRARVGGDPDPVEIRDMIRDSVRVQCCRNLQRPDGEHFRQLAIYWIPDRNVVIKVDEFNNTAVTVLSRHNGRKA